MQAGEFAVPEMNRIFNSLPFSIACLDREYRIIYGNKAYWDFIKIPEENIIGKPCYETVGEYAGVQDKTGKEKICSFCKIEDAAKSNKPTVIERPLGDKFIRVTSIPETDDSGSICRFLKIIEDLTELKQTEVALKKSRDEMERKVEERTFELGMANEELEHEIAGRRRIEDALMETNTMLQTLLNAIPEQIFFKDYGGRLLLGNNLFEECLGLKQEEFTGKTNNEVLPADVAELCNRSDEEAINRGKTTQSQEHYTDRNGEIRFLDVIKAPIYDVRGGLIGLVGVSRDITKRKQADSELRLHSEILENMAEGVFLVHTGDRKFVYANQQVERMFGYDPGELIGKHVSIVNAPCEKSPEETAAEIIESLNANGVWQGEVQSIRKDRTIFWCNKNITTYKHSQYGEVWISINQDITRRKLIEAALRQSEEKFRTLFEFAVDALFILDMDGNFIDVNRTAYERLGYTKAEMLSINISQLDHPDFADKILGRMEHLKKYGWCECESAHLRKDGTAMPVEINARFMDFQGRKVIFSVVRDITVRTMMEEALRQSEKRYHTLFTESPDGILLIDTVGKIIEFNETAHRQLGYSREEFEKLSLSDIDSVESPGEIQDRINRQLKEGKIEFDVKHRTKQGEIRDVQVISQPVDLSGKTFFHAIWLDITERKHMEEHLRKTIKERETLLRELYHRTKNNMNTISSLINLQTASLYGDEIAIQLFRDLQDRIMSMALVHERLYKSKDLSNVRLKDYVSDLANTLISGYKINRDKFSLRLDIEDLTLSIDTLIPCGLIINELMTNSLKYAFADGREGQIRIKGQLTAGSEIQLVYSDNGIGFPEGFDFAKVETLGLRLINGLITSQL
ncbi:MAG: PAS domain S-box protein, partial [Dissulfurispiraceae bacterium]